MGPRPVSASRSRHRTWMTNSGLTMVKGHIGATDFEVIGLHLRALNRLEPLLAFGIAESIAHLAEHLELPLGAGQTRRGTRGACPRALHRPRSTRAQRGRGRRRASPCRSVRPRGGPRCLPTRPPFLPRVAWQHRPGSPSGFGRPHAPPVSAEQGLHLGEDLLPRGRERLPVELHDIESAEAQRVGRVLQCGGHRETVGALFAIDGVEFASENAGGALEGLLRLFQIGATPR